MHGDKAQLPPISHQGLAYLSLLPDAAVTCTTGLEKLINANRSVSSVNDRLFPVELTEIADWKSMSEYMLCSNFGKP